MGTKTQDGQISLTKDPQMWFLRAVLQGGLLSLHHISSLVESDIAARVTKRLSEIDPNLAPEGRTLRDILTNDEEYVLGTLGDEHQQIVRTMTIAMALAICERSLVAIVGYCRERKGLEPIHTLRKRSGAILELLKKSCTDELGFAKPCFESKPWNDIQNWWKVRLVIVHGAGIVPEHNSDWSQACKALDIELEDVDDVRLGVVGHRIWPTVENVTAAIDACHSVIDHLLDHATKAGFDPVQVVLDRDAVHYKEFLAGKRKTPTTIRSLDRLLDHQRSEGR